MRDANAVAAAAFVDELARAGLREVCVAPGSRSTPLVLACAAHPSLRLFSHIDERSAAFFALGLGRATGRPAAVVTTSGTAVANLFPAVIEASQSEVPLLLLTADRPPELRGADANQTIDQVRVFGGYVRAWVEVSVPALAPAAAASTASPTLRVAEASGAGADAPALRRVRIAADRAWARAVGIPAGPVHVNLPFAKPLEPALAEGADPDEALASLRRAALVGAAAHDAPATRILPRRTGGVGLAVRALGDALSRAGQALLVAGPVPDPERVGPAALALARRCGQPLLADPLSGARWGAGAPDVSVGSYDLFLRDDGVRRRLRPDLIVRIGAAPTSAALAAYLEQHADVPHVVIDAGGRWKDHAGLASQYLEADPADVCRAAAETLAGANDPAWTHLWRRIEEVAREVVASEGEPFFEGTALAAVVDTLPADAALFVSNSMPVRDLDAFGAPRAQPLRAFGNRGASGIDGIVSTALGVAAGVGDARTVAVLGDLAFYHDMNGLLAVRRHGLDTIFVLINNDGGGIFNMLPVRRFEPWFTELFATPHGLDFAHAAALYGVPYEHVEGTTLAERLRAALETPGPRILEVRTEREANRRRHEEVARAVVDAVRPLLDEVGDDLPGLATGPLPGAPGGGATPGGLPGGPGGGPLH